jgi:hypothetical protein
MRVFDVVWTDVVFGLKTAFHDRLKVRESDLAVPLCPVEDGANELVIGVE